MSLYPNQIKAAFLASGIDAPTVLEFLNWLQNNRAIWEAFEGYAIQAMNATKKLGAKAVAERVRWYAEIEMNGRYLLNNNYVAYMARLFNIKYQVEYFETREIRGLKKAA
jgi:hypothetical protein